MICLLQRWTETNVEVDHRLWQELQNLAWIKTDLVSITKNKILSYIQ